MAQISQQKLAEIRKKLEEIRKKAEAISQKVATLKKAKEKGMEITPKTTVEEAQKYLLEAGEVKPQQTPEIPDTTETPDAQKSIDYAKFLKTSTPSHILELLAQRELERQEDWRKKVENWLSQLAEKIIKKERRSAAEELEEQFKKYGIPETFERIQRLTEEIEPLKEQLINLEKEEQEALLKAEQRMAPMVFIRGEKALIQRQYAAQKAALAAQIQAKAAQIEALQGNIQLAQQLAKQAVNAMTYDEEWEYRRLYDFIRLNQSFIDSLSAERRWFLNQLLEEKREELERKRQEKLQILKWATDPDTAPAFAGVDLTSLTLEEAADLVKEYLKTKPKEEEEYAPTRFKREWLEAGGLEGTGMTLTEWILRRTGMMEEKAREWTDEEIRATIRNFQAEGYSYEEVVNAFVLDDKILNKDRAVFIAGEMFGVVPPGMTYEEWLKKEKGIVSEKKKPVWEEVKVEEEKEEKKKPKKKTEPEFRLPKEIEKIGETLSSILPEDVIKLFK